MRLDIPTDINRLQSYLPRFVGLIGLKAWDKRESALIDQARASPFKSYVVQRYHWLELELAHLRRWRRRAGGLSPRMESAASTSALRFAAAVVEIDARLNAMGRAELRGRLRDALKSDGGFAPVYLEAMHVVNTAIEGFDVTCIDLESIARYDLAFERETVSFNLECKHISADAGRRIHQKDFYRLMHDLTGTPGQAKFLMNTATQSILLITLDDRLPAADASQKALLDAVVAVAAQPIGATIKGSFFSIAKLSHAAHFGFNPVTDRGALQQLIETSFGSNCHSISLGETRAGLTVVMRSLVEDDHSKPQLDAMKAAYRQLPTDRPAFISVQYDDLDFSELLLPHVTARMQLLSNYFFSTRPSDHIAAVLFNAYRPAAQLNPDEGWNPVVACWNPGIRQDLKVGLPFQDGVDHQQARALSEMTKSRPATKEEINRAPSSASWRRRMARRGIQDD